MPGWYRRRNRGAYQGGIVDPASLSPTLWQRPQDISATGSDVDAWANGGGSAGGSFTGSGATRPQGTTISGRECVDFVVASSDVIASALTIGTVIGASSGWSFFGVVRADTIAATSASIWLDEGWISDVTGYWGIYTRLVAGNPKIAAYHFDGAVRVAETDIVTGTPTMVQARWSGSGSPIRMRVGTGSEVTSANAGNITVTTDTLREGRGATGVGAYCDGVLAEPMAFNRAVTDTEAGQLRAYYAARYGVAT